MENGKQTIEFILMGRAVPEQRKDGRIGHCTAGYSPTTNSLVRLYPVPARMKMNRWDVFDVQVERDSRDTREESWKILDSKSRWSTAHERIVKKDILKRDKWIELVQKLSEEICIKELNNQCRSLAVIKPEIIESWVDQKEDPKNPWVYHHKQMTLNGYFLPKTGRESPFHVRVKYRCPNCQNKDPHNQQVLEWGTYLWFEKNPDDKDKVIDNLQLFNDEWEKYFLIGNLAFQRTSWVIIDIFRWKK